MAATTPARKTTGSGIRKTSFPSYKHITQSYITTITGESPHSLTPSMRFSNEHLPAIRGDSVDDPPSKKRTCNENFTNLDKSGYGGQNEKHKEIPLSLSNTK